MPRVENKIIRRRLVGAYVSSVVSISLVLLLVGLAALLLVNARSVSDYFKENVQVSIILKQETTDKEAESYAASLAKVPYIHSARLITREEGTEELKEMLGEDFLNVFETSPVPISVDITLLAEYVSPDSLEMVTNDIRKSKYVDEVECQQSLVDALNANLGKISMVLAVFIVLMLFISFVLINNTVRLDVFSRRFTVHTMKLVGATRAFIRGPYLWRAFLQGTLASMLAMLILRILLELARRSFEGLFDIITAKAMLSVMGIVLLSGIVICVVSTWFVVNRLISLSKDELYC